MVSDGGAHQTNSLIHGSVGLLVKQRCVFVRGARDSSKILAHVSLNCVAVIFTA